jgi:hypothetical protein
MIGDLLDSPWKILIIALVIIVLFGSRKLPAAAAAAQTAAATAASADQTRAEAPLRRPGRGPAVRASTGRSTRTRHVSGQ